MKSASASLLLAFLLAIFTPRLQADSITVMPWTGDASSGITAGRTLWAYHFRNSATTANVSGVAVPGIVGVNPSVAGEFSLTGVDGVFGDGNDLTALAGQGSAVLGSSFLSAYSFPHVAVSPSSGVPPPPPPDRDALPKKKGYENR